MLFVWNRLPVELVAIGAALALYGLGVLTLQQSLAGFGDPAVILIAALFVVSEGLDATGVTTWVGQSLVHAPAGESTRLLLFLMLLSAGLTALIGLNGTVAALLPMTVVDRDAALVPGVPAADAVGVRRQRRRPAAAHRQPGQRRHLRRPPTTPGSAASASPSSPSSASPS